MNTTTEISSKFFAHSKKTQEIHNFLKSLLTCTNYVNLKFMELSDKKLHSSKKLVSKRFPCYTKGTPMSTVKMSLDVRKQEKIPHIFFTCILKL